MPRRSKPSILSRKQKKTFREMTRSVTSAEVKYLVNSYPRYSPGRTQKDAVLRANRRVQSQDFVREQKPLRILRNKGWPEEWSEFTTRSSRPRDMSARPKPNPPKKKR